LYVMNELIRSVLPKTKYSVRKLTGCKMTKPNWITNDPDAARELRVIDRKYNRAIKALRRLPLAEKIEAVRRLKISRAAAYKRVLKEG